MTSTIPFVDSHVHFWDLTHPTLTYGWLAPDAVHPILGDINAIKSTRYDATALWAEARFAGLRAAVHVQAAVGTPDPVDETEWLTGMARDSPVPFVIVAAVDLAADDAARQLERHAASPVLRGIRDFGTGDYLTDPAFERGFARLAEHGLLLDLDCPWENMAKARDLAHRHPDVPVVLEHLGYPRDTRSAEYFESWKAGITALAEADNVWCKISGVGMNRAGWTVEGLRPWVMHCIEAFGPRRCVFGTNWPVDRLWASYDAYASAFRELVGDFSHDEQEDMLFRTATTLYGLDRV